MSLNWSADGCYKENVTRTISSAKITLDIGEPERAGPADGRHQGHVCQEAGDDEEDEHQCGKNREFFKIPF